MSPRVTLGVATYERDTYLAEAVASCLRQTYDDLEVLVVLDGGAQPERRAGPGRLRRSAPAHRPPRAQPRDRRGLQHDHPRGPRRAHRHARRRRRLPSPTASPGRSRSSTAIPTPGVAHGAASIIDGQGVQRGTWPSQDRARHELLRHLVREHNTLVDPSRMVHRRVYEAVGGYSSDFRLAQDFDFWVRAVRALPLPRRARRAAHRPAPPRRQLLRRVRPGARGRRRCRTRCAR